MPKPTPPKNRNLRLYQPGRERHRNQDHWAAGLERYVLRPGHHCQGRVTLNLSNVDWQIIGTNLVGDALAPASYQVVATYAHLMAGPSVDCGVYSYDATQGHNKRWVTTADEFQVATGITDQQKEQMFYCNSKSWSTGWKDGDTNLVLEENYARILRSADTALSCDACRLLRQGIIRCRRKGSRQMVRFGEA